MPIYEYRCSACGHQEDHLCRVSDPPLNKCPQCGRKKYQKQVTAAGFQLKGSGWYATDFKNGKKPAEAKPGAQAEAKSESNTEAKADVKAEGKTEAKTQAKAATKTETKADAKAPASTTN